MMSLADARHLLSATGTMRHDEALGHAPIDRWYEEETDSRARARVVDAAEVVLAEGDDDEHDFALKVLALDASAERLSRLVDLYAARGWDSTHPLAEFFRWRRHLSPEARAVLLRLYTSDPEGHVMLLQPVLALDQDGAAWTAFVATLRDARTPRELVTAYRSCPADRFPAFLAAMRGREEPVVRRLARRIDGESALELLATCGYAFDPRPGPREPADAVPVEELLSLLESERCSLCHMLPAPGGHPEDRDRSIFYRRPRVPFPRSLFVRAGAGRFWDVWHRGDPPEVVSVESYSLEEFREHFRSQWGEPKRVSLCFVEPYACVPRFVLRHVDRRRPDGASG